MAVAAIVGDPSRVNVSVDANGKPQLEASCVSGAGEAAPAVRLAWFLEQFAPRSVLASICDAGLTAPIAQIAALATQHLGTPCLAGFIPDPRTCRAYDTRDGLYAELPSCAASPDADYCFHLDVDTARCPATPTHLAITVDRLSPPPPGTRLLVQCATETPRRDVARGHQGEGRDQGRWLHHGR